MSISVAHHLGCSPATDSHSTASNSTLRMFHPVLAAASLIGALFLFVAGMVMQGQPEPDGGGIIGNTYLFCMVVAGGIAGAGASLALLPRKESLSQQFVRFFVGSGGAIIITPFIVRYVKIPFYGDVLPQTPEVLLPAGAVVGLTVYAVLLRALPAIVNAWSKKAEDMTGATPPK